MITTRSKIQKQLHNHLDISFLLEADMQRTWSEIKLNIKSNKKDKLVIALSI